MKSFHLYAGIGMHALGGSLQVQHDWEQPRLVESPLGMSVDGDARRLARFASERAIHALGNGNPPALAELIGRAVMHVASLASTPTERTAP